MSYILDALRRAEAERQRGGVPGLHAPAATASGADDKATRRVVPLAWVLGGAALLLGGAALPWLLRDERAPELAPVTARQAAAEAVPQRPVAAVASATAPAPAPALAPAPAPAAVAPPAAAVATATPAALAPAAAASPRPRAPAATPAAAQVATMAPRPQPAASSAAAGAVVPPASAAASAPAERVLPFAELPAALRAQMPAIALGGGVYAEQASQRLVLVNGQVVREGDQLAADLKLLRILPRSVILSFRGQQFEMKL